MAGGLDKGTRADQPAAGGAQRWDRQPVGWPVGRWSFLYIYRLTSVLSWGVIGRPPHGVSRQWVVVVRYGMRHATGASLSTWFSKAAGLSCSTTTAGSWFQSPTVLAANELRSPDEDAPIALNLNRWFALVLLSAATKPIWSGPTATCPVTTLYNKASLRSRRRSLRSRQPRSCSIRVALDVVLWSPLTNLADRRCILSSKSQSHGRMRVPNWCCKFQCGAYILT